MGRPLEHVLRLPGAQLEDIALASASEFAEVDPAAAHHRLDLLAAGLVPAAGLPAGRRAEVLAAHLAGRRGLRPDARGPESLMLDRVLERRRGHPLALAIVYAAVARRAGFPLLPVGAGRFVILADGSTHPVVVFDPAGRRGRPPEELGWICPHVIGALMLDGLASRYVELGETATAIRAALPLGPPLRTRAIARLAGLRAVLN